MTPSRPAVAKCFFSVDPVGTATENSERWLASVLTSSRWCTKAFATAPQEIERTWVPGVASPGTTTRRSCRVVPAGEVWAIRRWSK